jgi:hypothetical protein
MAIQEVKVMYQFMGVFYIDADDFGTAKEIVQKDCGAVLNNIHTSQTEDVVRDWNFQTHPVNVKLSNNNRHSR